MVILQLLGGLALIIAAFGIRDFGQSWLVRAKTDRLSLEAELDFDMDDDDGEGGDGDDAPMTEAEMREALAEFEEALDSEPEGSERGERLAGLIEGLKLRLNTGTRH